MLGDKGLIGPMAVGNDAAGSGGIGFNTAAS